MTELMIIGYNFLTVLLPAVLTTVMLGRKDKEAGLHPPRRHLLLVFIFTVYVFGVFFVTGSGTIFELMRCNLGQKIRSIHWLPFSGGIDVTYGLNLLMLVPLGFLLPIIWPAAKGLAYTVVYGFSFSLFIEISQLFTFRSPDVDDLMMNTLGALTGYLLFRLLVQKKSPAGPSVSFRWEPAVYLASMFLGHFLLFDELGFVNLLYGL